MVEPGIVLGRYGGHVLRFRGPENVLLVGPQRQGKGIGIIIPTLLEMPRHTVAVDIRGDSWDATAGWRSQFSAVINFAPTQKCSHKFNILEEVRGGTEHEFRDAAILAEMLVDPGGGKGRKDHWEQTAKALITCAILYETHKNGRPSLGGMASFWSDPARTMEQTVRLVVETAPTRECAELGQEVLNKTANEASGVLSSMMTQLFVFRDPVLRENTASSTFRLADFTRTDRVTSLYLILSPGEEEHVRPFMRMFLRLALQRWMEDDGGQKHNITLLMDEFTSWGRIPFFVGNLAVLGGKGIRTLIAVQNIPQLATTYGQADVITEQCKVRIFFAAQGRTTAEEISRQTGTTTASTRQLSHQYSQGKRSRSISMTQHARPLLTPDEAMQLPEHVAIVQVAGHPSIWAQKTPFWKHEPWRTRAKMPPPEGRYYGLHRPG